MSFEPDQIVHNARHGQGACQGCPAQEVHQGEYVNPGLLNPDAELMFLTLDPSHRINWDRHVSWSDYNDEYGRKFASWRGGKKLSELIRPLGLTLDDIWLGDSVKCPVDNSLYRFDSSDDIEGCFNHCQHYLHTEVETINPNVIVSLGEDTTIRLLDMLFDIQISGLKTGTSDCGRLFETDPPVIVSPHWSHGWLDRSPTGKRNLEIVQKTLSQVYMDL